MSSESLLARETLVSSAVAINLIVITMTWRLLKAVDFLQLLNYLLSIYKGRVSVAGYLRPKSVVKTASQHGSVMEFRLDSNAVHCSRCNLIIYHRINC